MKYLLICFLFLSCYSVKKAEKNINKAQIYYPNVVAEKCNKFFPCIEIAEPVNDYHLIEEKIVKVTDTIKILMTEIDTIKNPERIIYLKEKINVANNLLQEFQKEIKEPTKTIRVIDSRLKQENEFLANELKEYQQKYERSMKLCVWLLVALSVSLIVNFIRK